MNSWTDTFSKRDETMPRVVVNPERCKSCEICVHACPKECLKISEETNASGYFVVRFESEERCTGCLICGEMCPDLALQVWK